MQQKKIVQALVSIGLVGLLAACGGGGGSNSGSNGGSSGTPPTNGAVNMAMTDGPSDTFNHVWVTVTAISFHTNPNQIWSATDASWQTTTLPAPVTIDLAQLNNGLMTTVFANMNLPTGTYKQVRFFFASDTDSLAASAQATLDNESTPSPLQWNDQVEYINASGAVAEAPLEIAYPVQGIQLLGNFNVTAGGTLNLATDFDLDKIVIPYMQGSMQAFTMKPDLAYFNLATSGGISGSVDTTNLCANSAPPFTNCSFNLIAHAEMLSADGTRYEDVRSTTVKSDGTFTLAPLNLQDSNGNPIKYDIVIRGRQMQTLVVTGVTPAGTYTGTTISNPALLQPNGAGTLLPVTYAPEYGSNFAGSVTASGTYGLQPLTSGYVVFQQTLSITGLPHEIRWANTNPYTGFIDRLGSGLAPWNANFWLTDSALMVADYNGGSALTFNSISPQEGNGGYNVAGNETAYYNFGANYLMAPPGTLPTSTLTFLLNNSYAPTLQTGVANGTVTGTVAIGSIGPEYVSAQVVLARFAHIITVQDIPTADLVQNGTFNFSLTGIGAGSSSASVPGAYYYAYVRLVKNNGGHTIVPIHGAIDLRSTNSVTGMNVSVVE